MDKIKLLQDEIKGSFDFFLEYTNLDSDSGGFGLTVDCTKKHNVASIASVGFALTAWVIACERGYISHERAQDITRKTLRTLNFNVSNFRGFFSHFLHMENGERYRQCEYSTIDTSICLNGVITAAAYYHDAEISELAQKLLERVDWQFIIFNLGKTTLFRMAYNPDRNGDYVTGNPGFIQQWDMAAEQKMMYLQSTNQIDPAVARKLYHGFSRDMGDFEGQKIIINPGGNLFAYHFTEAWLDTASYLDPDGIDWFNNTRLAILANRSFCIKNSGTYKTYHDKSWGISCGDSPWGYDVSGSTPCLGTPVHNGTVSISGALASLPYAPDQTMDMMKYLYEFQPRTWGKYGFYDSYNLDVTPAWYSKSIYGIDKGCSMIMIENYLSRLIWDVYTSSPYIQRAMHILGFKKHNGSKSEEVLSRSQSVLAE